MSAAIPVKQIGSKATFFVMCVMFLCALDAAFMVAITVVRPLADNVPLIVLLLGVTSPVVLALLAAAVQQVHLAVNSRLSQLLELTAKSSRAEGQLVGLMEPTPGSAGQARAEGKAAGVEQERVRAAEHPT